MSQLNPQNQLVIELISAMSQRRCSHTWSDSYYWNERILSLCFTLLENSNSELSKLLHRIINNSRWFQHHYRASLCTLQQVQAQKDTLSARKHLSAVFERDRGVRLDVGVTNEAQAERQEVELRQIARWRQIEAKMPLGLHPVEPEMQQQQQELQLWLTPDSSLVSQLEAEMMIQEKAGNDRGTIVEEAVEDMILSFWATNPDI